RRPVPSRVDHEPRGPARAPPRGAGGADLVRPRNDAGPPERSGGPAIQVSRAVPARIRRMEELLDERARRRAELAAWRPGLHALAEALAAEIEARLRKFAGRVAALEGLGLRLVDAHVVAVARGDFRVPRGLAGRHRGVEVGLDRILAGLARGAAGFDAV